MDKNVFINDVNVVSVGNFSKVVINLFDKNYKTATFSTSLMSKYNAEKYEREALMMLGLKDWFDAKFGVIIKEFTMLTDSENEKEIVGLASKKGMLLKNEVKRFVLEQAKEQIK